MFWVGIGGWGVNALGQAGTAIGNSGLGKHQAWTEVLPDQGATVAAPLYATEGQGFYTDVTHLKYSDGSNEGFKFYLENIPTGNTYAPLTQSTHYNGATAEAITEKNGSNDLANFDKAYYYYTDVQHSGSGYGIGTYPNDKIIMHNGTTGDTLATPSSLSNSGQDFYVQQNHCK